jgi:hypothetical protein
MPVTRPDTAIPSTAYSGLHVGVRQHQLRQRSPSLYEPLTPPSPGGRGGIGWSGGTLIPTTLRGSRLRV